VLRRAHWFGQEWCEEVNLSQHGRDAHAPLFRDPKPNMLGYPWLPPKRSASVLAGLFRAEAGVGTDLKLSEFILRGDFLGKQGANDGCQKTDGNTDERRVF